MQVAFDVSTLQPVGRELGLVPDQITFTLKPRHL